MPHKILLLPGDGIGPEVMAEAKRLLAWLADRRGIAFETEEALIGGAAYEAEGVALSDEGGGRGDPGSGRRPAMG
jgi:3-isopropylmalate dehydrogenase